MKAFAIFLLIRAFTHPMFSQDKPTFRHHGIRVFSSDIEASRRFYKEVLGIGIIAENESASDAFPIYLTRASESSVSNYPLGARTGLSIQTHKLLPGIDHLRSRNVSLYDTLLQRNGVGISIPFKDPSGHVLSLIEVQIRKIPAFEGYKVYNTGVTISDMEKVSAFYLDILGFDEWSRNYLPEALPLKHTDGTFAFMIHQKGNLKRNPLEYGDAQMVLLFETSNLNDTREYLKEQGVLFKEIGDKVICKDPEGNAIEIFESVQ
ncbi:VOC family protein [Ekhidna sp.]|uniref:VOC family protein n=1 Tax=Ekhidna sp. TaxID=2608089 RepID=UPI003B507F8B